VRKREGGREKERTGRGIKDDGEGRDEGCNV